MTAAQLIRQYGPRVYQQVVQRAMQRRHAAALARPPRKLPVRLASGETAFVTPAQLAAIRSRVKREAAQNAATEQAGNSILTKGIDALIPGAGQFVGPIVSALNPFDSEPLTEAERLNNALQEAHARQAIALQNTVEAGDNTTAHAPTVLDQIHQALAMPDVENTDVEGTNRKGVL